MKSYLFVPFMMVFSAFAHADGFGASALKAESAFELSIDYAQVAVGLTRACGPQFGHTLIAGLQKKQSSLELQESVSELSQRFPLCDRALQQYRIVANEIYERQNASLIAFQKKHAQLSSQINQATILANDGAGLTIAPIGLTAVEDRPDSFLVSGITPAGSVALSLAIKKDGAPDRDLLWFRIPNFLPAPTPWQKRIYIHQGPGGYDLLLMQQTAASPQTVWSQMGATFISTTATQNPYLLPSDQVQSDDPTIMALAKQITAHAANDMQKLEAVHDWVSENITYDYDLLNKMNQGQDADKVYGEPLSATLTLKKKTGICQEYSFLTAALLRAAGVPAQVIYGQTPEGAHAWNSAYVSGRWVILDTTWDAVDGRAYFDPAPAQFAKDHYAAQETYF